MIAAALVALTLVVPARGAWTTGHLVNTPRAWRVGGSLPAASTSSPTG